MDYEPNPYVYVYYSPYLRARARKCSTNYRGHRVVRDGKTMPTDQALAAAGVKA